MSTAQKWTADSSASVAANFSVSSPWVIWGTLYAAYGVSMVLRLMPAFAANAMRSDPSLNVDVQAIGTMLASGTMGISVASSSGAGPLTAGVHARFFHWRWCLNPSA